MIGLEDRRQMVQEILQAHRAGARLYRACEVAGIDVPTLQRGGGRPLAEWPKPAHALSAAERAEVLAVANETRFADEERYVASETTFSRILRAHRQNMHRGRARAPTECRLPSTHVANAPREVGCWDMTDRRGDNGATLKATTVLAMLHCLGVKPSYSRPRGSDDKAFVESRFHTAKIGPSAHKAASKTSRRPAHGLTPSWVGATTRIANVLRVIQKGPNNFLKSRRYTALWQ